MHINLSLEGCYLHLASRPVFTLLHKPIPLHNPAARLVYPLHTTKPQPTLSPSHAAGSAEENFIFPNPSAGKTSITLPTVPQPEGARCSPAQQQTTSSRRTSKPHKSPQRSHPAPRKGWGPCRNTSGSLKTPATRGGGRAEAGRRLLPRTRGAWAGGTGVQEPPRLGWGRRTMGWGYEGQ